jgi:exopolysaccharide biosynthesis polyprenyl glycosylphosphotransferase
MIRLRHKMLMRAMMLLDQAVLIATAMGIIYHRPLLSLPGKSAPLLPHRFADSLGMLVLAIGWLGIFSCYVNYKSDPFGNIRFQLRNLLKATTLAAFWLLIVTALFSVRSVDTVGVVIFWVVVTFINSLSRVALKLFLISARRSGYNRRYLLVVGANTRSEEVVSRIVKRPELGYNLVGFVAESVESKQAWEEKAGRAPVMGVMDDLKGILERERVDEMLVCLSGEVKFLTMAGIIAHARDLGIVLRILPDAAENAVLRKLHVEEFENEFVLTLFREQLLLQLLVKRAVDILASSTALVLLSPLMTVVALMIRVTSPGPALFAQDRVGMNQRRFRLYKFRSMVVDADERKKDLAHLNEKDGPAFKILNDPRITKLGRFLRKTSIDELPQLFNVLKGEMSLVGPRPPLPDEVSRYDWLFRRRLSVKPGITCVWQVSGRSTTTFDEWMKMDKHYVENWCLWLDFKILLKTIPAVLFCKGAS